MQRYALPLLLTVLALLLVGCNSAPDRTTPYRVACVGDSITFGAGISQREINSYPAQLGRLLGEDYTVQNFGVNGATMIRNGDKPYWNQPEYLRVHEFQPDIIILMLGTNDTKPHNWQHNEDFEPAYTDMVRTFQIFATHPEIYICNPVPVVGVQWGINDTTVREGVIPVVTRVAEQTGVHHIDLYSVLEGQPELLPDHVHPNAEGAKRMAQAIAEALEDWE